MPKVLKLNKSAEEGVRELLKFLLTNGKVKGVFTLRKTGEKDSVAYSLISDPADLDNAVPLFPLMPANAGKILSRLTLGNSAAAPVAVVAKPCELRALVELVKRGQGNLENFLFISTTCGGVYPLEMMVNGEVEGKLSQYWDTVKKGKITPDIRPACTGCEYFVPYNADMTVSLVGDPDVDKQCRIFLNTDRGEQFTAGMAGELLEQELDKEALAASRCDRAAQKKKLFDEVNVDGFNLQKAVERCIGCHGCSKACPICYCYLCYFDSGAEEYGQSHYEAELEKTGYASVLPNNSLYHLIRLFHIGISCVGCGQCSDVCPVNIPLWNITLKAGEEIQKAFDYIPGRDVEEGVPITTFEAEEPASVA